MQAGASNVATLLIGRIIGGLAIGYSNESLLQRPLTAHIWKGALHDRSLVQRRGSKLLSEFVLNLFEN
jgi:hypothetical protein